MSELGSRLKQAREERKLTLEELQSITKIQKRYLLAIEEGNLDMLPGQFYARAFVKSYAEAVGINPDLIFEEHANELPASNKKEAEIPPRVQKRKTGGTKKTQRFLALLPSVIAVVFIMAILVGVWYFLQTNSTADEGIPKEQLQSPVEGGRDEEALKTVEEETDEEAVTEEEVEEDPVEEVPQQELVVVETIRNETIYNLVNATEFTFKIDLQGKSYVGIDNRKGKTFHAANVDGGKSLNFDFSEEETIQFNFGASNNVNLFINDEPFEFPQDIVHQKVTFHFQQDPTQ
ncbi:helix-turn-helix domain-containing protein [Anaerobacillus sp. CMMVII]|uniref:helix-turn-helix domain-containing protein n=1 Tax=Anaerobacillus sp. CMMVII TaxID=2755588 RepID=UPI0021B7B18A|nr:helix-turn-helix domain-containing protein [Anaerobacillus sp. CMMVII]MCT8139882.1 helix-turn-helix domain-containing protein [Anaerobacillus sp. CMMVII]